MPVLLRQYLKLNARAFAYSIDPAFSDVLDAMVLVDLLAVPVSVLGRYMGAAAAQEYRAWHTADLSALTDRADARLSA